MTSKELLHRNKDLTKHWLAVANETWFEELLVYAKAHMIDRGCTTEDLAGANKLVEALKDFGTGTETSVEIPGPGLFNDPLGTAKEMDLKQKSKKVK